MWGFENEGKYPYFFMTGSARTGKTFMTRKIVDMLNNKKIDYLLMVPTGVAAQNISGKTIHSTLRLKQTDGHYQTLLLDDESSKIALSRIKVIIIDEISMVSDELFTFLSNIFGSLHKNHKVFGGISILVIRDLAQLPPINGEQVFFSQAWKPFPLFLTKPQRQRDDLEFYQLL
jgi:ATP-dependent exoDNAse (exonuclease V) alpha subunit